MHACCVAGATDAAVRTLDEMALMGFAPSTFIYNVAMEACARTGVRGVLSLLLWVSWTASPAYLPT